MENYVGKRLDGRYEIMEIIGVGGMAVVYKAFDNIDHRIVAVKILKDEFIANEEFKRRFKNESKAIAVLSHKNIVKVFDVSYGDMLQYIVMEYVEGIALKEYMQQQGKVDPREAIYFVTQILRALQHAHDKGIVHRDIKPQNIMLQSDGTIKVTDFGIARFSRSETRTMTDGAIGSVHYISPEQAKGSVTDAKTDLYSVGVVLYEMLTGKLPFQSDNAVSVALMQLQNDPAMPREINPDIPVGLEQIIMRAMQKNQNDRYQSASEILLDLDAYKRNPNIKFDYSYNTDHQPIGVPAYGEKNNAVSGEAKVVEPVEEDEFNGFDSEIDAKNKKKTIAILSGVLSALVIFAVALIIMFSSGSNKLPVPELVGLNFYSDVDNNSLYASYKIEPIIDENSEEDEGTIIDQEPRNGSIARDRVITVYISGPKGTKKVPDVTDMPYNTAESKLKSEGFDVAILKEPSDTVEIGWVIRTEPEAGETAQDGSLVTIYIATNEEVEPVDVPDLLGMTISEAREALQQAGLRLNENVTYRASLKQYGTIIGYEHVGEEVLPGTRISVFVSTGKAPEETTEDTTEETTEEKTTEEKTTKEKTTKEKTTKPKTTESTTKKTTTEPSTTKPTTSATTTTKPTTTASTTKPTEATTEPTATAATTTAPPESSNIQEAENDGE